MKISIVGYGAMGKILEQCLKEQNIEIASIIDPFASGASHKEINENSLNDTDVCICFTTPSVALDSIRKISTLKKQIVMATTGWLDKMDEAKNIVRSNGTGMIYSSNFSLGVNIFFELVGIASKLVSRFEEYDVLGYELHHNRKKDSPSGTAKTLEQIILDNFSGKQKAIEEKLDRAIEPGEFHFASVRGGDIPGIHTVQFESVFDSIKLEHSARSRVGFAKGAVLAAGWILGKKGVYNEKNLTEAILKTE